MKTATAVVSAAREDGSGKLGFFCSAVVAAASERNGENEAGKLKSSERTKDNFVFVYTTTGFYLTTTDLNRSRIYIRQRFFIIQQRFF